MKHCITLVALCLSLTAFGQETVKFTASKANDFGIVYKLPTTVLDVTIEARHTVKVPGEFYKYANKYLGIDNPITEKSVNWEVLSVNVNARGIADNRQEYLMQFKSGSTPFVMLTDNGLPLTINREEVELPDNPVLPEPVAVSPTPLETEAARQAITEEMLKSQSLAKRAELAAQRIYELRSSRNELITGQADVMPDGEAMKIIISQIDAQEAALMAMFIGTTSISTDVETFTYIPGDDSNRHIIARLSTIDGFVDSDNLSGDPIYLSTRVTSRGKMPLNEKGETKPFPKGGVAYCIPGSGQLTVEFNGRIYWDGSFDAAQYGIVYGVDPKMFIDKKAPAYAIFNPITGGLKELGTVTP